MSTTTTQTLDASQIQEKIARFRQIKEAITLYTEGQSLLKLANHFGVATDTVAHALRRAGVILRPRRGWTR